MSEPLLSIGTFSRAASLSVKTLRAYHAQGLLTPAAVDPRPASDGTQRGSSRMLP